MRNLIAFLARYASLFFFLLLQGVCIFLLYKSNVFHNSLFFNAFTEISGRVYYASSEVKNFLNLQATNAELMLKNGELEARILKLEDQLKNQQAASAEVAPFVVDSLHPPKMYDFVTGRVVNNSISHLDNYITINKGANDGVNPDMGVVSATGLVGIVKSVSPNYAIVLPVLNTQFRQSVKIKGTDSFGTLRWEGKDSKYANLNELPRHQPVKVGDVVITSGFSSIFPEGVIVGKVAGFDKRSDDNFYNLKVELSTDFYNLSFVRVIKSNLATERQQLELEVNGDAQ